MNYDVVIVGAGPAGLHSARLCREKGLRTAVLEEHTRIGKPVQCSGLVSSNLRKLVRIDEEWIENRVKGAVIHSPSGEEIELRKKGTAAYVIDREKFDRWLSERAGCDIFTGTRAESVSVGDCVTVKTKERVFRSDILLGCDGPLSMVREHFGEKPQEMMTGLIAVTEERDHSDYVEMWYDKRLSEDGFMWRIPRGESVEYGMFSSKPDFRKVERFFSLGGCRKSAGLIPLGFQKTFFKRTLLVGDAASQVKPWSGGGVVYGMTAAEIAARTVAKCFENEDFSELSLSVYEHEWGKRFWKNIAMGMMFRKIYREMDNAQVDRFLGMMKSLSGKINFLDMDFPAEGMGKLFG